MKKMSMPTLKYGRFLFDKTCANKNGYKKNWYDDLYPCPYCQFWHRTRKKRKDGFLFVGKLDECQYMQKAYAICGGKTNLVKISESTFALKVEKEN